MSQNHRRTSDSQEGNAKSPAVIQKTVSSETQNINFFDTYGAGYTRYGFWQVLRTNTHLVNLFNKAIGFFDNKNFKDFVQIDKLQQSAYQGINGTTIFF